MSKTGKGTTYVLSLPLATPSPARGVEGCQFSPAKNAASAAEGQLLGPSYCEFLRKIDSAIWRQECEHLRCIESLPCFCCSLTPGTHLVFPGPIPSGESILAPCGPLTFTLWDSVGLTGIFIVGSDCLSVCSFCSRWYWRGNWAAFRQSLWRACAALRGHSRFALPVSLF